MNYKTMWEELKSEIKQDLKYHESGEMQSMAESVHGETKCKAFLHKMKRIEKRYENE